MQHHIYEEKSLNKLIFMFGIPSILALLIEMLTSIVDTAFAGNLPGVGDSALAAMALISPVLGLFTALQTLFAMSTGILIAKYLNDQQKLSNSYSTGVIMTIAVALAVSTITYLVLPKILLLLGAQGQVLALAGDYMRIQLFSQIFSSIGYTLTCCIRAFGYPKTEAVIILGAVVINIAFNYLFAFVFDMGIGGLAWGTFVSELSCAVIAFLWLKKNHFWVRKSNLTVTGFVQNALALIKIGLAQTIIQTLGNCTGFFMNARLLELGSMIDVAAWSIVQRISVFLLMPIVGLTQGVQTIIAYFNGNCLTKKNNTITRLTMFYCSCYGMVTMMAMVFFGDYFLDLFGCSQDIFVLAKGMLMISFIGFPFVGILYTNMTILQVTEHELASVLLILSRQLFFMVPLLYLMPALWAHFSLTIPPVMAVLLAMPVADILATALAIVLKRKMN